MRLLTRSDFDGLACAAILKEVGIIDNWMFVHPKDLQDGIIEVTDNDVLANVPYVEGCKMWFDHHSSESERLGNDVRFEGESRLAPSAAGVIFDYYGGISKYPHFKEMIKAVDNVDSGNLTIEEILNPTGWVLLGFIMDSRTGLGRFREFNISNYELMELLIEACRTKNIDEIMSLPDVIERVELYHEQAALFKDMVAKYSYVVDNVLVSDLRGVETIYSGNRFLVYSLYPKQNISLWIVDGRDKLNCSIALGYSIINKTSTVNVGSLLLSYGGGGHKQVGTCQVSYEISDTVILEIINHVKDSTCTLRQV
jgi:nanoRNase/pAp phosphatase (c-di-AMP/oligoRNAs hydrolase)